MRDTLYEVFTSIVDFLDLCARSGVSSTAPVRSCKFEQIVKWYYAFGSDRVLHYCIFVHELTLPITQYQCHVCHGNCSKNKKSIATLIVWDPWMESLFSFVPNLVSWIPHLRLMIIYLIWYITITGNKVQQTSETTFVWMYLSIRCFTLTGR